MTSKRTSPESRPTTPATGGRSLANVPWPRRLLARCRGGSSGASRAIPFFPRILVHLVGLDGRIAQRIAVQPQEGVLLEAVPQPQQLHPIAAQLARQPRGGGPLGDATEDQQDLGGPSLPAVEDRAGEGVEDPAAVATDQRQLDFPVSDD